MITPDYCRLMSRYNSWQNTSLVTAASTLDHEARWQDRGAFFGSIAATLNHLLWDDALWLERFAGNARAEETVNPTLDAPADWDGFTTLRRQRDGEIAAWAAGLKAVDVTGEVTWYPAGGTERVVKPRQLCIMHLFNHQTHHRGQVHCMLTAAGATPEATDLPMLA